MVWLSGEAAAGMHIMLARGALAWQGCFACCLAPGLIAGPCAAVLCFQPSA